MLSPLKPAPGTQPQPPAPAPASADDLYPDVVDFKFDRNVEQVLKSNGYGKFIEETQADIAAGGQRKAARLKMATEITDQINQNNNASNWLNSKARITQDQVTANQTSVGGMQAFLGLTWNGLVDMVEGVGKLGQAYTQLGPNSNFTKAGIIDNKAWERANKGIEAFFEPLRTYVSDDYQKPIASYSKENGVEIDLDFKSLVGTAGNLFSYILPGLVTAGAGSISTIGTRAALRGAATVAERAALGGQLAETASTVKNITGLSSFLQTFPSYQKEALDAGLSITNATLFAMPVAALNAVIETANVGALAKAMGLSDDLAKVAIRQVAQSELKTALQGMAGKPLTKELFLESAKAASKGVLGQLSNPKNMSAVSRMLSATGRRIGRGFQEQGLSEGGEELLQSLVENGAKDLYNNFVSASGTVAGAGRFEDPTWQNYAFDAIYGTFLGALVGTGTGTVFQQKYSDPTVYGYVAANVRNSLGKNIPFEQLVRSENTPGNLKIYDVLDNALSTGELTQDQHTDLVQKVGLMAEVARDFQGIPGLADSDQVNMVQIAQTRQTLAGERATIDTLKADLATIDQAIQSGQLTPGERLKSEIQRNALLKEIGQPDQNGEFEREKRLNTGQQAFESIADQVLNQYATDTPRPQIAAFFKNNLAAWNRQYGTNVRYADPFSPTEQVTTPEGQTIVYDQSKRFFRRLLQTGGEITAPASLDANGKYVPAQRNPVQYNTSMPVDDINEHVAYSDALADDQSELAQTVQPFTQPDNSLENGWITDGAELVGQLTAIEQPADGQPKPDAKVKAQVSELATAYLRDSEFLLNDPRYAQAYAPVRAELEQLLGIKPEEVQPEAQPEPETTTPTEQSTTNQQTPQGNESGTPQPVQSTAPASPTVEPDYAAELEREAKLIAANNAQQELDAALRAIEQGQQIDESTLAELVETVERTTDAVAAVVGDAYAESTEQPANPGNAPRRRTTQTLKQIWPTLPPQVQTDAANLAQEYLNGVDGGNLSPIEQQIYSTLGVLADLKEGWARWADPNSFTQSIARAYAAPVSNRSALRLDQYVAVQQETRPDLTEQDVIDFITKFPTGPASARTYGLAPVRQRFVDLTGKELNRAVAQNVLSWATEQPQSQPDGVEFFGESALDAGQQLMFSLTADDALTLSTLYRQYNDRYGDAWLTELISDIGNEFPPLSDALAARVQELINESPESYANAQSTLESGLSGPVAGAAERSDADSVRYSTEPDESTSTPAAEPASSAATETAAGDPAAEALSNTAESLGYEVESTGEATELVRIAESADAGIKAVESEIAAEASTDPETAEVVAPVDIALADANLRAETKRREITDLQRIADETPDPVVQVAIQQNIPTYNLRNVIEALRQGAITPEFVDRILQGEPIRSTAELKELLPTISPEVYQALEDSMVYGYLPNLINQAQQLTNLPPVSAAQNAVTQVQAELSAIQGEIADLQQQKVAVAEQAVQQAEQVEQPRFQFIGENAVLSSEGLNGQTLEDNLAIAQEEYQKAGITPETPFSEIQADPEKKSVWDRVRAATGWFVGMDRKWRYRVSDLPLKVKDWDTLAYQLTLNVPAGKMTQPVPLSYYFDIDYLVALYPQLSDWKVAFTNWPPDLYAAANPKAKTIIINNTYYGNRIREYAEGVDDAERRAESGRIARHLRGVLAHELQHAIQSIEGFGRGSNIKLGLERLIQEGRVNPMWANTPIQDLPDFVRNQARQRYRSWAGEIEARDTQVSINLTQEEIQQTQPFEAAQDWDDYPLENAIVELQNGTELQLATNENTQTTQTTNKYTQERGSDANNSGVAGRNTLRNNTETQENEALTSLVDQIRQAFPNINAFTDAASYERVLAQLSEKTGGRRPKGLVWKNAVYLDPSQADASTVLHEFGHLWAELTRTNNPELYQRGVTLVKDTVYYQKLLRDPFYSKLSKTALEEEALAQAIGDRGVQFVTPSRQKTFGDWLAELWAGIKAVFGFEPQEMTLDDFVRQAVGEITGGRPINESQNTPNGESQAPRFQLPPDAVVTSIDGMRQQAEAELQNPPSLRNGIVTDISQDLWSKPKPDRTREDVAYIKEVQEKTGWELTDPGTLIFNRSGSFYHLANGLSTSVDAYKIGNVLRSGFQAAWETPGTRGKALQFMLNKLRQYANIETFLEWIDDGTGTIGSLIKNLKRDSANRAAYTRVILEPLQAFAQRTLVDFSLTGGNTIDTVRRLELEVYDFDEEGNVITRTTEVPVGTAMELVAASTSQYASYNEASAVVDREVTPQELYEVNPDGSRTRLPRGAVYYNPLTERIENLLISRQTYDALKERFETGLDAYTGEVEAYQNLTQYFNNSEIADLLAEEVALFRPNEPFDKVSFYYPIRSFNPDVDPEQQSRNFTRTLKESRQIVSREAAGMAISIGDPVNTMRQYQNAVSDVVEYSRLNDNLNNLIRAIKNHYNGPAKLEIVDYLTKRRDEYQTYRKRRAEERQNSAYHRWFDNLSRRYTQSVFSLSLSIPAKQTGAYAAAFGQGVIEDKYLLDGGVLATLAKLTGGAYKDWSAPGTVLMDDPEEFGLKSRFTGDTEERPFLEELMGETMPDEVTKKLQRKRFATLLDRALNTNTVFAGTPSMDDLNLKETLNQRQKVIAKFDEFQDNFGMAAIRRSDRAVLLAFVEAAKLQATAEGLEANTNQWWDRVADLSTNVMYETNVMNQLSEKSPIQTSFNFLNKILGLYAGQSIKIANMVMKSLAQWAKTGQGTPEAQAALEKLAKTFSFAVIANALYVSVVGVGVSFVMALLSGDEPKSAEENLERIGFDFLRNVSGTFPGFAASSIDYFISQAQGYQNNDLLGVPAAENLQTGFKAIGEASDILKAYLEEDPEKLEKARDSFIYDITDFTAKSTGIPSSARKLMLEWSTTDADD